MSYSIDNIKNAYFIGIGGVSMSSLASILLLRGVNIYGYDMKPTELTRNLEEQGAIITYDVDSDIPGCIDTVIYTAAVNESHPLMIKAKNMNLTVLTRAQLLGAISDSHKISIGVAGTHGKSTTTGLLSSVCITENSETTVLSGANLPFLGSYFKTSNGDRIVFEACEYKNSYHSMIPNIKVILNCEHDHVDFFPTLDDVICSFRKFINDSNSDGKNISVVNLDCKNSVKAADGTSSKIYFYSIKENTDFYAYNIDMSSGFGKFSIRLNDGTSIENISIRLPGIHNVSNSVAAAAAAYLSGVTAGSIKEGLEAFTGVSRRFEYLGSTGGAHIYDDYAHHPDEIEVTLKAARNLPHKRIICVFQPHTFSRTYALKESFAGALSLADQVYLCPIYPARETNTFGISSQDIASLMESGAFVGSFEEIAEALAPQLKEGDLCITMGAGEAYKVANLILKK